MTIFIGIDLGTSGCRALAIDAQHHVVGETSVALPVPQRNGPHVEQDPTLWWNAVCQCLEPLSQQIDSRQVGAIAVDGTSGTLLLTDQHGKPLGPALMYNDARASTEAQTLASTAPADSAAHGPGCALAKLMWLRQHDAHFGQTAHACHQADWVAARLAGHFPRERLISDFNNALKLGFDPRQNRWPDWMGKLDVPTHLLPEVVAPGTPIGTLSPSLAQTFGLPDSTRIIAGTTDSTASLLATGASQVGDAVTVLGSTLVLKVISECPVSAPAYGVYSQPLNIDGSRRWLVGGASNSGGAVLRQHFTLAQLEEMTPRLQPDTPTGLDYYPLPSPGERFPVNNPQRAPRLAPRPADDVVFFQAMLEGMARIEADGYRLLAELGAPYPTSVRSTGGGASNEAWTSLRKKALNTQKAPLHPSSHGGVVFPTVWHREAAFGAALLAASSSR